MFLAPSDEFGRPASDASLEGLTGLGRRARVVSRQPSRRAQKSIRPSSSVARSGRVPLVHGDALWAGDVQLGGIAIGEAEPWAEPDASPGEVRLGGVEVWDPVDEHRLLAVEVLGEEQLRAVDGETEHRNASAEGFDGEHDLGPEPLDVVGELSGHVGAREVDELQLIEHLNRLPHPVPVR